jgi:hypothetical protein
VGVFCQASAWQFISLTVRRLPWLVRITKSLVSGNEDDDGGTVFLPHVGRGRASARHSINLVGRASFECGIPCPTRTHASKYRVVQESFPTSNLTSGSCCVYHIFFKVGSVVADIISFTFCIAHNILISWVRTLEVIRRPALDLTRARAWPVPFKQVVIRPARQRESANTPKTRNNN